jgi:hypothetical protein
LENDTIIGFIIFNKIFNSKWESPTEAVTQRGLGWKLHEIGFSLIYPDWFLPFRENNFRSNVPVIYKKFLIRDDIITNKIHKDDPEYLSVSETNDYWFNIMYKLTEPKVYDNIEIDKNGWIKTAGIKFFNKMYDIKIKNQLI